MNVSGRWLGEYQYSPPTIGRPATFTLELKQGWLGRVTGMVQDGPSGMPEAGSVKGWVRGNAVAFKKQMPIFRIATEDSTMPIAEYLEKSHSLQIAPDSPHPPIQYEGVIADDGHSIAGVWNMSAGAVRLEGQARAIRFQACSGSWTARREG